MSTLPPFSPVLDKLLASLADEDVSFSALADLIEKDTVLAGNVLRVVNSSLYGMRGTINSVRHAVSLLGLSRLRNTAMSLSIARMWRGQRACKGWSHRSFNRHSVACAILADLMAAEQPVEYPEGAFVSGLFHGIGMLLMAISFHDEFPVIQQRHQSGESSLFDCEREVLGLDHPALSAEVLRCWNLPLPIQQAVAAYHLPEEEASLAAILGRATRTAAHLGITPQSWIRPGPAPAPTPSRSLLDAFQAEFEPILPFFG